MLLEGIRELQQALAGLGADGSAAGAACSGSSSSSGEECESDVESQELQEEEKEEENYEEYYEVGGDGGYNDGGVREERAPGSTGTACRVGGGGTHTCQGFQYDTLVVGDEEQQAAAHAGLGCGALDVLGHARLAAEAGAQTETVLFAEFESHSRGIASRLMARMGYRQGGALGLRGTGLVAPLAVRLLPVRSGLGAAGQGPAAVQAARDTARGAKRKRRGGERSRRKKAATAVKERREAAAAEEAQAGVPGVFGLINNALRGGSGKPVDLANGSAPMAGRHATNLPVTAGQPLGRSQGGPTDAHRSRLAAPQAEVDGRAGLVGHGDRVAEVQAQVQHLQAMLQRNAGNRGLVPQIEAKLAAVRAELAAALAAQAQAAKSIQNKEANKRWLKF